MATLLEPSTLGLNGNGTIGLPPGTVSLVGGRGKGAGVRVDGNGDGGETVEGEGGETVEGEGGD